MDEPRLNFASVPVHPAGDGYDGPPWRLQSLKQVGPHSSVRNGGAGRKRRVFTMEVHAPVCSLSFHPWFPHTLGLASRPANRRESARRPPRDVCIGFRHPKISPTPPTSVALSLPTTGSAEVALNAPADWH